MLSLTRGTSSRVPTCCRSFCSSGASRSVPIHHQHKSSTGPLIRLTRTPLPTASATKMRRSEETEGHTTRIHYDADQAPQAAQLVPCKGEFMNWPHDAHVFTPLYPSRFSLHEQICLGDRGLCLHQCRFIKHLPEAIAASTHDQHMERLPQSVPPQLSTPSLSTPGN